MLGFRHGSASLLGRLFAVLVVFAVVTTACGGSSDDGGTAATDPDAEATDTGDATVDEPADEAIVETIEEETPDSGPVAGGIVRYGLDAEVDGLNPTTSAFGPSGLNMANAVFDTLGALAADGTTVVPYLAESFTPNDDLTSWTVKLRPGVTFHDGTPLNAEAVVDNFNRQLGDLLVGLAVNPFFAGVDEKITVVDDLTVTFNLAQPNAYYPSLVVGQVGMVASPTWLAAAEEDPTLNQQPVGTGPFVFDSRTADSVTRFVRNDDYWNGEVLLDAVEFFPVPDTDTRVDLFLEGDLEGFMANDCQRRPGRRGRRQLRGRSRRHGRGVVRDDQLLGCPLRRHPGAPGAHLRDPRQNYNDLIGLGVRRPAEQMFNPESPFYNPDVTQEADDPEAAIPLVEAYCAENGDLENTVTGTPVCTDGKINMEFQYSGPSVIQDRIADILNEGWNAAGFNVTYQVLPEDEHIQQTAFGQYNVNTWRQFGQDPAADNVWLWCAGVGGISLNWPRFCDESRDALLLEAMVTTDPDARAALYQEVVQKIRDDYLYVFLLRALWVNAFQANVNGVCERMSPEGDALYCALNGRTWFSSAWIGE